MKVSLPSELNCRSMLLCMTRMAFITTMMENTPTSTPSSVSAERSLCAVIAPMAIVKLSRASAKNEILFLFISQGVHGIHARRAPCGKETGKHAGQRRDRQRDAHDQRRQIRRHHFPQQQRRRPCDEQRDDAAQDADARRLNQELQQDGAAFG